MDARVARLKTLEDCERFTKNVLERNRPDLAEGARKRALALRAEGYGAKTQAERDCLAAVYAHDDLLTAQNGRKTRAVGTWNMIKRSDVLSAVERAVQHEANTADYAALRAMGLQDYAFEAVVLRYPELFSRETVQLSKQRFGRWKSTQHASQPPA